jgi:pyruvate/2-oxoglutarate/acetoin dehydrogenase E1 component
MPEATPRQLTFVDALREGLDQAMDADPRVIVIGEGVPDPKAIFTTTAGLRQKYGPRRVFDMPLSENGLTGACIGAALNGMRPVLIHQRVDFSLLAMDQIVNNAAKWHYMFDGKASVPIVVRMIMGRGWGQGPQHSQGLHAMYAQVPGLKVVMPSNPHDAKGMMMASIQDDNPVIFIEHRWLHRVIDSVPEKPYTIALDQAKLLKEGRADSVTIAAISYASLEALEAARALSACMAVEVEVIDIRSIRPLDHSTVSASVRKTGRLLVVDTAFETGSVSGEIVYRVAHDAFDALRAAPARLGMPDYPVPTSPFMTDGYYPGPQQIADSVLDLMGLAKTGSAYGLLRNALTNKGRHDTPHRDFTGPF